jgi:hypothetical protein
MGDDWARSIRRGIERCSLFLPVISRQALSEKNLGRYFWQEWDYAAECARGTAFIIPVVIDDTRIDRAPLPGSFKRSQGKSLPGGNVTPDVADQLIELVREFHRRAA